MKRKLSDQTAIITGASHGLGLAIAHAYVEAGASVLLCGRDKSSLEKARSEVSQLACSKQDVETQVADISKVEDVEVLVERSIESWSSLDILVNNAGIYGPKGCIEDVDWDEWQEAIRINLFGSVLMSRAVLPHMKERRYGKIVQLSGGGATGPMPMISAYAASKAAVVRFAETLAEEVSDFQIDVNAIAPGALNTRMLAEILDAGPEKVGQDRYNRAIKQRQDGGASAENAAGLAVFLGSEASNGITGKLISAVWDPWKSLRDHVDDLSESDVYTLRRIVPEDRGMTFGSG